MIILNFIIVLGILIFVHELGHFVVAKCTGVKVEKFSLGFGPKLIGFRYGETEYLLSALPLGGYVKMFGEGGFVEGGESHHPGDDEILPELPMTEEEKTRSFSHKTAWQRMAIVLAGPLSNIGFAWILYIVIYAAISFNGYLSLPPTVGNVQEGSPAALAGLQKGDVIVSIDGRKITEFDEIAFSIFKAAPDHAKVVYQRGTELKAVSIKPAYREDKDPTGSTKPIKRPIIGIGSTADVQKSPYSTMRVLRMATIRTVEGVQLNLIAFKKLVTSDLSLDNIGGPIQIAKHANVSAKSGVLVFLNFMAMVSVSLGILNLLPVPVLDGGHLLFYTIEIIIRRPVPQKVREYAQQAGLVLLLGLMVLAFYNDIMRYFIKQ